MKVSFDHKIDAPLEKVLDAFSDPEFYPSKQKASGAISVETQKHDVLENGDVEMVNRVSEPSRLPPFLRKGDVDTFVDESRLERSAGRLVWKITPEVGADKFFLSGQIDFKADGDKTRVTYATNLEVKVPLLGKKAEKLGLAKTEEETSRQADFLRKKRGQALAIKHFC